MPAAGAASKPGGPVPRECPFRVPHRPAAFEALTDEPWDERRARDGIAESPRRRGNYPLLDGADA
jgi:hypothetical protein